jgi:hypothetical protein
MSRLLRSPLVLPFVFLLAITGTLLAQADTAVVADKTGLFGGLINHYFGAIIALIQSALVWVFGKSSPTWKKFPEPLKWGVLYLVGFALTWISLKTGFGGVQIEGNALTTTGVLAAVPTLASGLIFKLGGHKVPPPPSAPEARTGPR